MVPLYGFVQGDTMGVLILVEDRDSIAAVAASLQQAVSVRVAPRERVWLRAGDRRLEPDQTVTEAGLSALDRIDLLPEAET